MRAAIFPRFALLFALVAPSLFSMSCSSVVQSLRRDLDDTQPEANAPTTGGQWPNGNFLSETVPYGGVPMSGAMVTGDTERGPASASPQAARSSKGLSGNTWIDSEQTDRNARDEVRGLQPGESTENGEITEAPPLQKRLYKSGNRATRADFVDDAQTEGSLWASNGQTNYYFTKNRIRSPADIISVSLEPEMIRDITLEIRRGLSDSEMNRELMLAQERIQRKTLGAANDGKGGPGGGTPGGAQASPERSPAGEAAAPAVEGEIPIATTADVDLAGSLELKEGDAMLAEIVERYPNGNYKIRGSKRVAYKNGQSRVVSLLGVVRGSDIAEDETVKSGKLYEYRLEAFR